MSGRHKHKKHKNNRGQESILHTEKPDGAPPQSNSAEKEPQKDKGESMIKKVFKRPESTTAVMTVALTAIVAIVYFLQWNTMEKTITLDQRAWVWIIPNKISLSNEPDESHECFLNIFFENSGKTPANEFWAQTAVTLSAGEPVLPGVFRPDTPVSKIVLAPGSDQPHQAEGCRSMTPEEFQAYKAQKMSMYWRIKLFYKDIFGKDRKSNVCIYHLHGWPLDRIAFCESGNTMD